jgi:tRNA(fMet)-specific endonuclease VapC
LALIIADTDVLIDYLAGIQPLAKRVADYIRADRVQITCINCFELLSGARGGKRGDGVRRFVASIAVLPLDRNSAAQAALLRQQLEERGESIGMADSLIAGIAIDNDMELLTRNRKHFEKVEGLRLLETDADAEDLSG